MTYQLRRSIESDNYRRDYLRVDTVLGETLGFMGLLAWIVMIMCSGYNRYLMKKHVYISKVKIVDSECDVEKRT